LNHSEPADRHVSEPVSVADGGAGAEDGVGGVGILGSCGAALD